MTFELILVSHVILLKCQSVLVQTPVNQHCSSSRCQLHYLLFKANMLSLRLFFGNDFSVKSAAPVSIWPVVDVFLGVQLFGIGYLISSKLTNRYWQVLLLPFCPLTSFLSRRGAACCILLPRVCASWRAFCVLWQPAARHQCSAGLAAPSCRAAASSRQAFASSGPTRLWDDVPLQVRTCTRNQQQCDQRCVLVFRWLDYALFCQMDKLRMLNQISIILVKNNLFISLINS